MAPQCRLHIAGAVFPRLTISVSLPSLTADHETVTKMKHFLQTAAVFSTLTAAKPLRNLHIHGCNDTWTVGQTVGTTSGAVEGHAASQAVEVSEYLGIPFAQPPTGSLRFQPPVAFNASSTINGTDFVSAQLSILEVILTTF